MRDALKQAGFPPEDAEPLVAEFTPFARDLREYPLLALYWGMTRPETLKFWSKLYRETALLQSLEGGAIRASTTTTKGFNTSAYQGYTDLLKA